MRILAILSRNSARGSRTRSPEAQVPYPAGFRGMITHEAARCTACRTCAYVCSPGAIAISETEGRFVEWAYFAGRCTYCGRCVEYCPTRCLGSEATMPPVAADQAAYRVTHLVPSQPCVHCGRPIFPLPLQTLRAMHGDPVPAAIVECQGLCERCRGKSAAERVKGWLGAGDHD